VKVTPEISAIRCVPAGEDCVSPPEHSAFSDVDGRIEFVELIAAETGLPVGIKSAVGESGFWQTLSEHMAATGGGPDFITVDGGEGGTGAAPLSFADHVALPFKLGFTRVYRTFARTGLAESVMFIGSGFPDSALFAFAPHLKSTRAANYLVTLRAELLALARSCGVEHPALVTPEHMEIVTERYASAPLAEVFGYEPEWPVLSAARRQQIEGFAAARPA
jgi:Conserved region in glutamate synthase